MTNPTFNTDLGQHILKNPGIVDSIISKAKIKPTDIILEIGGGTGNLTMKLLQKAKKVVCYEKDQRLASELVKRVATVPGLSSKLQLIVDDALKHDFPYFDMCISNTPYQISSPLVFKLMNYNFKCAFLMFQKEFGDRLVARPGTKDYCRLSVAVQIVAQVDNVLKVARKNFNPPPKVDSCVVRIQIRHPKPPIDLTDFNKLLKICFLRKNKTLLSIFKGNGILDQLSKSSNLEKEEALNLCSSILTKGDLIGLRASKMEIEDFLGLLLEFKKAKINF